MTKVWAIAKLTFWEGIRMRIVLVFLVALAFILMLFPTALHGDGTVGGRLQNFLSYALGAVTLLLGVATVFLSCATLSNEIRTFQIHMVLSKPVGRAQVLMGKWLGVVLLNSILLTLCAVAIYSFARVIKNLPETNTRDRMNIDDVVWTARVGAAPDQPRAEWQKAAEEHVKGLVQSGALAADPGLVDKAFAERLNAEEVDWRTIADAQSRDFVFSNMVAPTEAAEAMQVRFRARGIPIPLEELLPVEWQFVDPATGAVMGDPFYTEKRSAQRHQFLIRGKAIIKDGKAVLRVSNPYTPNDPVRIQFEEKNALEILYKVGSFEANFLKAVALTFLQLAFLAALGLFFSTFVSFPVACLCTFTALLIGMAYPFWMEAIGANMQFWSAEADPYGNLGPVLRWALVPMLWLFPDFSRLSGGGKLVDGEYISYALLGEAALRTLGAGCLVLFTIGWWVFRRREIASVQV